MNQKMLSGRMMRSVPIALGLALTTAALAQQQASQPSSAATLKLPENPQLFGGALPSVVKATAIVNGEVITQTDIDQRLALLAIANNAPIPPNEIDRLRQQVLSNLIDETLQIQAAQAEEIEITQADIDKTVERVASNVKQTPDQMADYLKSRGSSIRSIRRQIQGEIAWRRLQSKKIESGVSVGDEEVQAVIDKLNASKGAEEFRVGEIFISANSTNEAQAQQNAQKVFAALQQGGSFVGYARQFSEASTAAVGGDLVHGRRTGDPSKWSSIQEPHISAVGHHVALDALFGGDAYGSQQVAPSGVVQEARIGAAGPEGAIGRGGEEA